MATTTINDLINPEVMADMISAKVPNSIVVTPFAKVDNTLVGQPGDTITVPKYSYIGDAVDVAEGVEADTAKLEAGSSSVTVKKAMKAVTITDEAVLSSYGQPVGEITNQLAKSIAAKLDTDCLNAAINGAQLRFYDASNKIKYTNIVDAIDLLNEEFNSEKVMFVNPAQVSTLRKDSDFISADKYAGNVIMTGEIGMIGNARIVPSRKVGTVDTYYKFDASGSTIVSSGASEGEVNLEAVTPTLPIAKVGDKVSLVSTKSYNNVLIKLTSDPESEDETPALTIYLKRDTNVETERHSLSRTTDISADKVYAVALSDTSKVVLARIKA